MTDQLHAMIYVYDLMKSAEPSTPFTFVVLDHESINRCFRVFARAWRGTRGPAVVDADSSDSESNDDSESGEAHVYLGGS